MVTPDIPVENVTLNPVYIDKADIAAYAAEDVKVMVKKGLVKGEGNKINPLSNTTRAEAAVLLYRVYNK